MAMKEAISELRAAIRRLRPRLLLRGEGDGSSSSSSLAHHESLLSPTTATSSNNGKSASHNAKGDDGSNNIVDETNESSSSFAAVDELQLEAASELANAIASFVWNLDCLWDSTIISSGEYDIDDGEAMMIHGDGQKQIIPNKVENGEEKERTKNNERTQKNGSVVQEPHTEWNKDAKSLIREGYGLIATASHLPSSFIDEADDSGNEKNTTDHPQQQCEALRTIARTSILDLLQSVSTSPCRHFLLEFLPHFMPLALLFPTSKSGGEGGDECSIPLWLRDHGDIMQDNVKKNLQQRSHNYVHQSIGLVSVTMQILEAFQSLIQTDVSTLVPFLATLSVLFENLPDDGDGDDGTHTLDTSSGRDILRESIPFSLTDDPSSTDDTSKNARNKCFHLCRSSLSTVSEYDLPALLHSLFTLVRNEDEGRLAMEALRTEWTSIICGSDSNNSNTQSGGSGDTNNTNHISNHLGLFIGNVIIQSLLSEQMPGSRHLAIGFLGALSDSLHDIHLVVSIEQPKLQTQARKEYQSSPLTTLDVIVLIALYSHQEYQCLVESIIDSMAPRETLSFINLIHPLIQSWLPSSNLRRRSDRERPDSLLYEPLASPLISILFYIIMASSSVGAQDGHTGTVLTGGLLPFHTSNGQNSTAITDFSEQYMVTNSCCMVLSDLFSVVDPQRQEQIVNSLLSMVSDSFVRSTPSDLQKSRRRQQGKVSRETKYHQLALLEAARAACRTLLLISNKHASDLSQIRGTVLDRLLMLASMSMPTNSSTENDNVGESTIAYYHLFDMNCALSISLLQDTHRGISHSGEEETLHISTATVDGSGSSELLILCQKLLFSSNFMSTSTSISNNSYQHRAICGLILASRLLRCKLIPNGERGSISSWIMTVISPSPSAVTPLEALDPEIAHWGLTFLHFASTQIPGNSPKAASDGNFKCDPCFPEMAHFVDTQSVYGQSDVFNQVNKMLATAAIIQMEDSLRVPLRVPLSESDATPLTFLAFSDVSTHEHLRKKKSLAITSMIICAPYFLHGRSPQKEGDRSKQSLPSIDLVANYVYDLVERYLELGKLKSGSWNPRGWLLAKIQLPCCLSESAMEILGMKKHYGLELDADLEEHATRNIYEVDTRDDDFRKRWKLLFTDETKSKAVLVGNLVEFVNCVIISISVSCAVLKHAYNHFENEEAQLAMMGNGEASDPLSPTPDTSDEARKLQKRKRKQLEALRKLLQFQVNKIHAMQRICKNIYTALVSLFSIARTNRNQRMLGSVLKMDDAGSTTGHHVGNKVVSRGRSENKASTYQRKQIPGRLANGVGGRIVTTIDMFLSSEANTIGSSILWSCLDDDVDDAILLETFKGIKPKDSTEKGTSSSISREARILRLRTNILRRLQHNIINNKTGLPVSDSEGQQQHYGVVSLHGISRVFRMALSLMPYLNKIDKGEDGNDGTDQGRSSLGALLAVHYKLLLAVFSFATKYIATRSSLKDNVLLREKRKRQSEPKVSGNTDSWFANVIQKCAESSLEEGHRCSSSTVSTPTGILSEIFLRQLKQCEDASISSHIIDLLSILFINTECSRGILAKLASDTLHSVYTSSVGNANLPYTFFRLKSVLTEAATYEEHESDNMSFVKECLSPLFLTSNTLLKAKDSFAAAFVHHLLAFWSALILEGASQFLCLAEMVDALGSFLSSAFRRTKQISSSTPRMKNVLPGLNEKTYTALFELLCHMINASYALSKPRRSKKKVSPKSDQTEGPYGEVIWPLEIYSKLLTIFQSNHVFFPRRFLLTVVKSSLLMVRLSDYQLRKCVQWRNSQHSQIGIGMDCAAADLLQPLVDSVALHCIGCIISFCNAMKVKPNGNSRGWGSSYKHTKAIAGLLYRCEGITETLESVCQSQNLISPKDVASLQDPHGSRKRKIYDDGDVAPESKRRSCTGEMPPQRKTRPRGSNDKTLSSPSVLELLPESGHSKGLLYGSIDGAFNLQSDSEDSKERADDGDLMMGSDDDDSFGVVGDWAT